jgi:hypothetical protein
MLFFSHTVLIDSEFGSIPDPIYEAVGEAAVEKVSIGNGEREPDYSDT